MPLTISQIWILLSLLSMALLPAEMILAGEEDTANIGDVFFDGRHRVDLSYTSIDGFDGDAIFWIPGYTYSFSPSFRVEARTSFVEFDFPANADFGIEEDFNASGWGDSLIGFQYDPGANLTSGAWVPDTIGLFGSVIMPTGDKDKGLTGDTWEAEVGFGWLVDFPWNFWLLPAAAYRNTFNAGETTYRINEAGLGLGFYWLFPFRAWVGIEPYYGWDMERDTDTDALRIVAGKAFPNGMSIDLQYGTQDRVEQGAARDDDVLLLTLSWQFGDPPD